MTTSPFLLNKAILVTGAGTGIGRELALGLAREGALVGVNDIGAAASNVAAEIQATGGRAIACIGDISKESQAQAMVHQVVEQFGGIDGVVNNAGVLRDKLFHKLDTDDWKLVIDVHLHGSFHISRAAAPFFKEQQSGAMVHMTSTSGLIGNLGQSNYSAAKMGIVGLSRSIALDMAKFNVRSNCIAPFAWTAMTSSIPAVTPEQIARVERFKRMTPDKIVPLTAYLLSDRGSDVTGQIFSVRNNEVFVMSQPRPVRSVHRQEGWSAQTLAEHGMPALRAAFTPLERSADVFTWDPV